MGNSFEKNPYEKHKITKKDIEEYDKKIDRREFILKGAKILGGLALGGSIIGGILKATEDMPKKPDRAKKKLPPGPKKIEEKVQNNFEEEVTHEQEEIYHENIAAVEKQIGYDRKGDITLDSRSMINHWKDQYHKFPKNLKKAFSDMAEYADELKTIFREEGVPEKYIYLAIPESNFKLNAVSRKNAKGPYQITKGTAIRILPKLNIHLKIGKQHDDRTDPIKSGRACARLLKDNYRLCNSDWDLALATYNGSFAWDYVRYARKRGEFVSYVNYQRYTEKLINQKRKEIMAIKPFPYRVEKNETLSSIAQRFGLREEDLLKYNRLARNNLYPGQKMRIPYSEERKRKIYDREMQGYYENLTYPEKFNAVDELIKEGFVTERKEARILGARKKS